MIYLFNSCSRPLYADNICNTLFLPKLWSNEYRYKFRGEHPNVKEEDAPEFTKKRLFKREAVIIIFVDRYNEGEYKYYPIRKGELIRCREIGNQLFFEIKLLKCIYPKNIQLFNSKIKEIPNIPILTERGPTDFNDGYYAIKSELDVIKACEMYSDEQEAWEKITDNISDAQAFQSNTTQEVIFSRLSVKTKYYHKIFSKQRTYLNVIRRKQHECELYYKFPYQNDKNNIILSLESKGSLILYKDEYMINGRADNFRLKFTTKRYSDELFDNIAFNFRLPKEDSSKQLISAKKSLDVKITNSKMFWFMLMIAGLIYIISEILPPICTLGSPECALSYVSWHDIVELLLKGISIYMFIYLLGKKLF